MIICPWCGTNYIEFQSNCRNCGGVLPAIDRSPQTGEKDGVENPTPPPSPRSFSDSYAWRLLIADGWAITAFVSGLLGAIFGLLGIILTLVIITAFIGIPFLLLGMGLFLAAVCLVFWRHENAKKAVQVLRDGEATRGRFVAAEENPSIRINGRHPWVLRYAFQANGTGYEGGVTTFNSQAREYRVGGTIWVLYLQSDPEWNTIYPHPG